MEKVSSFLLMLHVRQLCPNREHTHMQAGEPPFPADHHTQSQDPFHFIVAEEATSHFLRKT